MSAGLYVLPAGGVDQQQPHTEDEIYVVLAGRSSFTAGQETRAVEPDDVIFVGAGVPHRFHDITEELRVVVVFAPAENERYSAGAGIRPEGGKRRRTPESVRLLRGARKSP